MIEVLRRTMRERWPLLLIGLPLLFLSVVPVALGAPPETAFGAGALMMVIFAAGIVARDIRSGTVQMILARPLRRSGYLFGRYFGVVFLEAIFLAGAAAAGWAVGQISHHPVPMGVELLAALGRLLQASLYGALLLLFSTFLPGYGDVLGYVLLWILFGIGGQIAAALERDAVRRVIGTVKNQVLPEPPWEGILRSGRWLHPAAGAWALAVAGALAVATLVFSAREFSYAHE